MQELYRVVFALPVGASRVEDGKELSEEGGVRLDVVHNFHLVEEDQGVEHGERRVVQDSSKDHIFQVLQPPGTPNLPANQRVLDRHNFLVARLVCQVLSVVRLVGREFGIICDIRLACGSPPRENQMSSYIPEPRPPPE